MKLWRRSFISRLLWECFIILLKESYSLTIWVVNKIPLKAIIESIKSLFFDVWGCLEMGVFAWERIVDQLYGRWYTCHVTNDVEKRARGRLHACIIITHLIIASEWLGRCIDLSSLGRCFKLLSLGRCIEFSYVHTLCLLKKVNTVKFREKNIESFEM